VIEERGVEVHAVIRIEASKLQHEIGVMLRVERRRCASFRAFAASTVTHGAVSGVSMRAALEILAAAGLWMSIRCTASCVVLNAADRASDRPL